MPKTIPLKKDDLKTVRHELTAEELIQQSRRILEIKDKAMKDQVHYGIIPGCKKPSLWKPGAEKLCAAFRLEPEFETTSREDPNRTINWQKWDYDKRKQIEGVTRGYIEYDSRCSLTHIPTGEVWVSNVSGSCNNFESKYRSLNPYDVKNTLEKMAEKRSLVAAVLIGTAASDIFTQDIEDLPNLIDEDSEPPASKPNTESTNANHNGTRMATDRQVAYIKSQIKKKSISQDEFLKEWNDYFESWEEIPFSIVNDILEWIREQS
ncbi:hypothetical protein D1BOALGB6SA_4898 [Olavius sp. associated proteobacterium Delta 1]|nr:hypothetical protein D1BOALGB6SA_4898 [Olavius sp. associated proteobacterium Delta 1]